MIEKGSSRGEEDVVVEDVVDNIFEQRNTVACTNILVQVQDVAGVGFPQTLVEGGSEVPGTGCMRSIALTRAAAKLFLLMLA